MKKVYLAIAVLASVTLFSCSNENYAGDYSPTDPDNGIEAINFGLKAKAITRGDITGPDAAKLLGNFFYVMGTKGTEEATYPTTTVVFDNYFVQYTANTAGTTESNTANWEYVGKNPGTTPTGYPKLSGINGAQTVKYWDYTQRQYDFFAFSTGNKTPVTSEPVAGQVGVTRMTQGVTLVGNPAYTFKILDEASLKEVYITDITEVLKADYGKEVSLRFKNLGSKVRIALYETIPGYAVSDVKFYTVDVADATIFSATAGGESTGLGTGTTTTATLISTGSIPTSGEIAVSFPHIGTDNEGEADYNQASVNVTAGSSTVAYHGFGALTDNYVAGENDLSGGNIYLGRTLPTATFAGSKADDYYTTVFPVSSSNALTLRVDYTLTATDGSGETIKVYGAKASVPANYTVWRPNYAYTYVFKISDATNGWTTKDATADNRGLYPITFDAVVAEATDATAEQTTVTTVETPSVTTYQQGHDHANKDEYSKSQKAGKDETNVKNLYVQVMNTAASPATLISGLTATNSLLYELSSDVTEAKVLDALTMRTTAVSEDNVTGRNGIGLTKTSSINNAVTSIVNGVDDNPITVGTGTAGEIAIADLTAGKSYAYVYIQTAKTKEVNMFEPVTVTSGSKINSSETSHKYYALTTAQVEGGADVPAAGEAPADEYVYFSVVVDGNGNRTYYYISTLGKATIPGGCKKVLKTALTEVTGEDTAAASTFYFDKYILNDGKYAVKVFKVVA